MTIDVKGAAEFLKARDDYLILMHSSPDGDTVGSGCALCGALQRMGKKAKAVCADPVPERFRYMFGAFCEQEFEPKTVVCVDVAETKLLGDMKETGNKAELCIDHHVSNALYAERTLLEPDSAAAAEIVYKVIAELGVPFDKELANCVYTAIATDTGCFCYGNTTSRSHEIAAEMIRCGAEVSRINYAMFELKTKGRMRLEQEVLSGIKFFSEGHIALISVSLDTVNSIDGIDTEDVGALTAIPRQIEGVEVGVNIKQKKPDVFNASVRTNGRVNAAEICAKFGGGGHDRAAGCTFAGSTYEDVESAIVKACCEACEKAGLS